MNFLRLVRFIAIFIILSGCASNLDWKVTALSQADTNLSHIKNNLVFFNVSIEPPDTAIYYKLSSVWGVDQGSKREFVFPLFDNAIMKSKDVPYTLEGNKLRQTVFMDLPIGTYTITKLDIVALGRAPTTSNKASHQLYPPMVINVGSGETAYFGSVDIRVLGVEKQGDFKKANLNITLSRPTKQDKDRLKNAYRALSSVEIKSKQMSQEY